MSDPKQKLADKAQMTGEIATSPEPDAGGPTKDRADRDGGANRSMPGINTDRRSNMEKSGGQSAQSGGGGTGTGTPGTQTSELADGGAAKAASDGESKPADKEDENYVPRSDPAEERELVIAPETADTDSLTRLAQWNQLPVFATGTLREQNVQDRGTASRDELALFPTLADGNRDISNFICRGAQATVGTGNIAYLYDEPTCPEQYVRGVEMARFTGSGRMVRLWMTATSLAPGVQIHDEWLRIYVDDNPRPLIQIRVDQVLGGAQEIFATPFGSGTHNAIAWHYPVVFSKKLVVALDYLVNEYFYEIDAVLDDVPQRRVAGGKRRGARDTAHACLANPSPVPANAAQLSQEAITLGANEQRHIELTGPTTIEELVLRVPQDKLAALSGVRISARWDDASAPAIDLPLLSLFAAGHTVPNADSLALTSRVEGSDQVLSLRLPMPFNSKAAWDVTNAGTAPAAFSLTWNGEAGVPDQPHGRLSVQFQEAAIPLTQNEQHISTLNGRGRLVGVCGDIVGRSESSVLGSTQSDPMDLARGDMRVVVDDELALQSTATDHYANNALYFTDAPRGTPFAQAWGRVVTESENRGQISFCRWHVLGNEIDFKRTLSVSREAAQRDTSIIDLHRTVAYTYLE